MKVLIVSRDLHFGWELWQALYRSDALEPCAATLPRLPRGGFEHAVLKDFQPRLVFVIQGTPVEAGMLSDYDVWELPVPDAVRRGEVLRIAREHAESVAQDRIDALKDDGVDPVVAESFVYVAEEYVA